MYTFISDRFRAIRHDLIVQQLDPPEAVQLLEPMIPFYLKAKKRCEMLRTSGYDKKLHSSELDECFSRWISAAKQGAKVDSDVSLEPWNWCQDNLEYFSDYKSLCVLLFEQGWNAIGDSGHLWIHRFDFRISVSVD